MNIDTTSSPQSLDASQAPATRAPGKQGLYDPAFEHDACGVGFVAHIKGEKSHAIVQQGLLILKNLDHRGAVGADPLMGDGAGIGPEIVVKALSRPEVRALCRPLVIGDAITRLVSGNRLCSFFTVIFDQNLKGLFLPNEVDVNTGAQWSMFPNVFQ